MRKTILSAMLSLGALHVSLAAVEERKIPKPTPPQLAWQQAELGVIYHLDPRTFHGKDFAQGELRYKPVKDINMFNPTELDTDQWLKVAKSMGARFAILVASHETGLRLWQSDANPFSLKAVRWGDGKRDIVAEFFASCKKYDIKPGVFMDVRWNTQLGIVNFKVTKRSPLTQAQYTTLIEKEVEEICSRYGDLFELWFDGGSGPGPKDGGPDTLGIVEKYQKNCLFYFNQDRGDVRWGGSETGTVPYPCWATFPASSMGDPQNLRNLFPLLKTGAPSGDYWMPAMSDAPLRNHNWFWDEGEDQKIRPLKALVNMYYNSVGRNSTLIIGLTPDTRGLIPEPDVKRCAEWGDAIRNDFSNCVGQTQGAGNFIELALPKPETFDLIVLQEDIRQGERVRAFVLEALQNGTWQPLAKGTCMGHKFIHRLEKPITTDKLRLKIEASIATPVISKMAIYLKK